MNLASSEVSMPSREAIEVSPSPERLRKEAERVAGNIKEAYDQIIAPFKEDVYPRRSRSEGLSDFSHLKCVDGKIVKGEPNPDVPTEKISVLDPAVALGHRWQEFFATIKEYKQYHLEDLEEYSLRLREVVGLFYDFGALVENGAREEGKREGASWQGALSHLIYELGKSSQAAVCSQALKTYWEGASLVALARYNHEEKFRNIERNGVLGAACACHLLTNEQVVSAIGQSFHLVGWERGLKIAPSTVVEDMNDGVDAWLVDRGGRRVAAVQIKSHYSPSCLGLNLEIERAGNKGDLPYLWVTLTHGGFNEENARIVDPNLGKPKEGLALEIRQRPDIVVVTLERKGSYG